MSTIFNTISNLIIGGVITLTILSCGSKNNTQKEEQLTANTTNQAQLPDSLLNSDSTNVELSKVATMPNSVILTGLAAHRLITIYKANSNNTSNNQNRFSSLKYSADADVSSYDAATPYLPGIDVLYGYNLLNVAHYDLGTQQLNYLFKRSVLIKTLYYPSYNQDSLFNKPINRNYYLVSVYDYDTNNDNVINNKDLRHFYYFNQTNTLKIQLIPAQYSVIKSEYDPQNDAMYVFAQLDQNKNGKREVNEPTHIFWINLKNPTLAKRMY